MGNYHDDYYDDYGRGDYYHRHHRHDDEDDGRRRWSDYYRDYDNDDYREYDHYRDRDDDDDGRTGYYYGATPSFRGMMYASSRARTTTNANANVMGEGGGRTSTMSLSDVSHRHDNRLDHDSQHPHHHPASHRPYQSQSLAIHRGSVSPRAYRELDYTTNRVWQEDDHTYQPFDGRRRSSATISSGGSIVSGVGGGPPGKIVVSTTTSAEYREGLEDVFVDGLEGNHIIGAADPTPITASTGRRLSCPIAGGIGNAEGGRARGGNDERRGDANAYHNLHDREGDGKGGSDGTMDERRESGYMSNEVWRSQDQGGPPRGPDPSSEVHHVRGGAYFGGRRRHSAPEGGDVDTAHRRSAVGGEIVFPSPQWHHQSVTPFAPSAHPAGYLDGAFVDGAAISAVSYYQNRPQNSESLHHAHQGRFHPHVRESIRSTHLPHQMSKAACRDEDRHPQRGGMLVEPYFERVEEHPQYLKVDGNEGSQSSAGAGRMKSPSVAVAIADARLPPPQSLGAPAPLPPPRPNKRVLFSHLQIRTYETIISDNPSCSGGPSLGIGWRYDPVHYVATVDEYAAHQARLYGATHDGQPIEPRPEELVLHRCEREAMLLKAGYTRKDIVDSVRALNKAKSKRRQTVHNLPVAFVDERLEVVKRTLRRWILNKKRTRHMYEEWKKRTHTGGG